MMTDTTANGTSSNGSGSNAKSSSAESSSGTQHPDAKEMARVVSQIPDIATGNAIVGPAEEREGRVAIPLASVSAAYGIGFGAGSGPMHAGDTGEGTGEGIGGGGGGRGTARPVAVVELTDSELKVHQVVDSTRITIASLALAGWCVFWITRTIGSFRRR
jgi:uncharacterized spore protein YtfJ